MYNYKLEMQMVNSEYFLKYAQYFFAATWFWVFQVKAQEFLCRKAIPLCNDQNVWQSLIGRHLVLYPLCLNLICLPYFFFLRLF
jgi:hypothetical protein